MPPDASLIAHLLQLPCGVRCARPIAWHETGRGPARVGDVRYKRSSFVMVTGAFDGDPGLLDGTGTGCTGDTSCCFIGLHPQIIGPTCLHRGGGGALLYYGRKNTRRLPDGNQSAEHVLWGLRAFILKWIHIYTRLKLIGH